MATKSKSKVVEEVIEEEEEMMDDENIREVIPLESLMEQGIAKAEISKLENGEIRSVKGLLSRKKKELCNIKGLSEAKVDKILAAAAKLVDVDFKPGLEVEQQRKSVYRISTGSKELDNLLQGGIESQSITEVFGESKCGKTQLMFTLAVRAQLPRSQNGGAGKVLYIDTNGSFRGERIKAIAKSLGLDPDQTLDNVCVCQVNTSDQQMELVKKASKYLISTDFALLIVDSLMGLFRSEYAGRGELSTRQIMVSKHMADLRIAANEFNIAVVVTNEVVANPDGMFAAAAPKPIGGNIVSHNSTTRLSMRKGRGENRIVKIYDSPLLGECDANIAITEEGVTDAK